MAELPAREEMEFDAVIVGVSRLSMIVGTDDDGVDDVDGGVADE